AAVTSHGATTLTDRSSAHLLIGARLKAGASAAQAAAEIDAIGRTLEREYPEQNRETRFRVLASSPVPGNGGPMVAFLALLLALPFPVDLSLTLHSRVIAFTVGLSLVAALLSGLAPAMQASKADVMSGLRNDAGLAGRLRLRHAFVIGQVAFSIVLIIGAGLFVRALQRAASIDPGFDPHGVELASLDLAQAGYTKTTGPRFAREIVDRVRELRRVQTGTIASGLAGGVEVGRGRLSGR